MGIHRGFWYYTIGQRQGLGLAGGPWFVVKKDVERNQVFISKDYYAHDKKRNVCIVSRCNWIGAIPESDELEVKLRHGAKKYRASVKLIDQDRYQISLADDDQGIAQGQFAVFYQENVCLGSGIIT